MPVEYINPDSMQQSPVFTQAIIVPAGQRLLIIGGQNGVDRNGEIVGKDDVVAQAEQAIKNLKTVLDTAGARVEDLVKTTVIIDQNADLQAAYGAWAKFWGNRKNPPTVTALRVAGLARPGVLIEIEAQAVLP